MSKKYVIGAVLIGILSIAAGLFFQPDPSVVSKNNAPAGGMVYDAPTPAKQPSNGDANF